MRVLRPSTLALFRGKLYCEWCGLPSRCEPNHLYSRGSGQLDIRCNLVALCGVFAGGKNCHNEFHNGHEPDWDQLIVLIAKREKTTREDIREVRNLLVRIPPRLSQARIIGYLEEISPSASRLAMNELTFAGILK